LWPAPLYAERQAESYREAAKLWVVDSVEDDLETAGTTPEDHR